MSKIMNCKETHYSVRQKIGDAGSISTQNMFPVHCVTPKRPESPYYGAKCFVFWGCGGGHFSKWIFAEGRSTRSPWCLEKKTRTHLEVQGSFGDEGTFQECQKSSIFQKPTIRWDRKFETRGLFRRRICFRSVLSRQNALNLHMEQNMFFYRKTNFSFF